MNLNLSPDQRRALEKIRMWFHSADCMWPFLLLGAAGTGKTCVAQAIPAAIGASNPLYLAPTGKAAQRLRSVGCIPAMTIHTALNGRPRTDMCPATCKQCDREKNTPCGRTLRFDFSEEVLPHDLVIVDEASMVGKRLGTALAARCAALIAIGDPAQLSPIDDDPYFRPEHCADTFELTTIHRQAEGGPVLEVATAARQGKPLPLVGRSGVIGIHVPIETLLAQDWVPDVILTGRRDTRWQIVRAVRRAQGKPVDYPVPGDVLMVQKNDKRGTRDPLFNGQQVRVTDVLCSCRSCTPATCSSEELVIDAFDEDDRPVRRVFDRLGFAENTETTPKGNRSITFTEAVTVHKAQGSEWDTVLIIDESKIFGAGWLYTAVTRAREQVVIMPRQTETGV